MFTGISVISVIVKMSKAFIIGNLSVLCLLSISVSEHIFSIAIFLGAHEGIEWAVAELSIVIYR